MKNIIFTILLLTSLSACNNTPETAAEEAPEAIENMVTLTEAQLANAGLSVGKIEQRNISSVLKVNGTIDVPPQNMVSISVPLGGYLKSSKLLAGMHVAKGEVIAIMEDQQYITIQQDYLTAKARLGFVEGEYNRQQELNKSKAASDKVLQQAQIEFTTQKILVKSLYEKLKLIGINPETLTEDNLSRSINVHSPIDGFVSEVDVNIGKYVNPSDVLFELVNPSDIHLMLYVYEKDLDKLFIGQKLFAYTNNNPEKRYPCEIILIGKNLSKERSVEVHCHFAKFDKSLFPGMFMNADIEVKSSKANTLPEEAIVSFENKQYAFVAKSNTEFEMLEIKAGGSENGFTEILSERDLSGLNFVVKGAYTLLMKMKNAEE